MRRWKALRVALLAGTAVWLAACADGYPTEDGALVLTYGMSTDATLSAMNTIGQHSYLEHHWRYELDDVCRLRVRSRGLDGGEITLPTSGPRLQTRVVVAGGERSHMVFAQAPGSAALRGTMVLGGANEFDAGQMKWLVEYLATSCQNMPAPIR
ncbi:hypothetical protein [Hydrogenophaga sp.]|jgi:hypothetical protein|uniref:hypothetical protein n=1 Tax=Hydrogenophaga sp. TaxID=1904254 RepID=UPI003F70E0A2